MRDLDSMPLLPASTALSLDVPFSLLDMDYTSPPSSPRSAAGENHLSPRAACFDDNGIEVLLSSIDQAYFDYQATEHDELDYDTDCQWWGSLFQRLSAQHKAKHDQWDADLTKAKAQGRGYREQLTSKIRSRLALFRSSTPSTQSSDDDSSRTLPQAGRGMKVSKEQSQLLQQSFSGQEREEDQWQTVQLELTSRVLKDDGKPSRAMPALEDGTRKDKVQVQPLSKFEKLQTEEHELKAERTRLLATIDKLNADKLELQSAVRESERKRARDVKTHRRVQEELARENLRLESLVSRLKEGQTAIIPLAGGVQRSDSLSTLVPGDAAETAVATALSECGTTRAEVEQLRELWGHRPLSSRSRTTTAPHEWTVSAPPNQRTSSKLGNLDCRTEYERQIKHLRDEYTNVIAHLEQQLEQAQRRAKSTDMWHTLVRRVKELERTRDEEKGEWKLQLEGGLAKNRRLSEAKAAVEKELANLQARFDKEAKQWQDRVHEAEQEQALRTDQLQESLSKLEQYEQQTMHERERMEEIMARHEAEIKEWEDMVEELAERYETEIAELKEHHDREIQDRDVILEATRLTERQRMGGELSAMDSYEDNVVNGDNVDVPMLDEALALAHGLTDILHGQMEDADMLDVLRNLSDMFDEHERTVATASQVLYATVQNAGEHRFQSPRVERPQEPVQTPMSANGHRGVPRMM